jgi:DeoD family purine-nucleoside phosphorylase
VTLHVHPTAALAARVLLPGDPGRALLLAQALLDAPAMFNHNRGLWGYSGTAHDGEPLTIQSTGMGGPSAAIVITELIELGARRLIRIGTCGALDPCIALGDLIAASHALAADGTSRALGAPERVSGDTALVERLAASGEVRRASVVSSDLFYEDRDELQAGWARAGIAAVEMQCATLFALAARRKVQAAALLIVSDRLVPARAGISGEALHGEALHAAEHRAGELALAALQTPPDPSSTGARAAAGGRVEPPATAGAQAEG